MAIEQFKNFEAERPDCGKNKKQEYETMETMTKRELTALSLPELKLALKAASAEVQRIESVIASKKASESFRPGLRYQVDGNGNLRLTESGAAEEEAATLKLMESIGTRLGLPPAGAKAFANRGMGVETPGACGAAGRLSVTPGTPWPEMRTAPLIRTTAVRSTARDGHPWRSRHERVDQE